MGDKDSDVRANAAKAIGQIGESAVHDLIRELRTTYKMQGSIGENELIASIKHIHLVRANASIASGAARMLLLFELIPLLHDEHESERSFAAEALWRMVGENAVAFATASFSHHYLELCHEIDSNGNFVEKRSVKAVVGVPELLPLLQDGMRDFRADAAQTLGKLQTEWDLRIFALQAHTPVVVSNHVLGTGQHPFPVEAGPPEHEEVEGEMERLKARLRELEAQLASPDLQ